MGCTCPTANEDQEAYANRALQESQYPVGIVKSNPNRPNKRLIMKDANVDQKKYLTD